MVGKIRVFSEWRLRRTYPRSSSPATRIAPISPWSVSLTQPKRFGRDALHRRMSGCTRKTGPLRRRLIDAANMRIELDAQALDFRTLLATLVKDIAIN